MLLDLFLKGHSGSWMLFKMIEVGGGADNRARLGLETYSYDDPQVLKTK